MEAVLRYIRVKPSNAAELALLRIFDRQPKSGHSWPGVTMAIGDLTLFRVKKIDAAYFSEDFDTIIGYFQYDIEEKIENQLSAEA